MGTIKRELRELRAEADKKAKLSGRHIPKEVITAVETLMNELDREYNSPEAKAERERRYQELCRIGKLRRQAFESGQNMDEIAPLPFRPNRDVYRPGMTPQEWVKAFTQGDD